MAYIPAIDINKLSVGMLINKIDSKGSEDFKIRMNESNKAWDTLKGFRKEYYKDTDNILLKDIY
jgi:membrane protein